MKELRDKRGLTEEEFLRQYNPDKYPKPFLTADIVVFRKPEKEEGSSEVLLIRRGGHPYMGYWALPGGFAKQGETLEQTAARELEEETGITGVSLKLVGVYSEPGRDPRGWVVSAAYAAMIGKEAATARAGDDAEDIRWARLECDREGNWRFLTEQKEKLAFDHQRILSDAITVMQK